MGMALLNRITEGQEYQFRSKMPISQKPQARFPLHGQDHTHLFHGDPGSKRCTWFYSLNQFRGKCLLLRVARGQGEKRTYTAIQNVTRVLQGLPKITSPCRVCGSIAKDYARDKRLQGLQLQHNTYGNHWPFGTIWYRTGVSQLYCPTAKTHHMPCYHLTS